MGYIEKFGRAVAHLKELDAVLGKWIDAEPYDLVRERNRDDTEEVVHAKVRHRIPPGVPLIIGDAIYNFRSSLDHLAYALAVSNLGAAPNTDDVMCPIHSAIGSYMVSGARATRHFSPTVQGIVEKMQPYHAGNAMKDHPLGLLNKLSNIDKHRHLAFGGTLAESSTITLNANTRDAEVEVRGNAVHLVDFVLYSRSDHPL
ncbi:MAG: hypothetical protein AAB224_01280, partial [Gemmatimonadota bacterium]